MWTSKSLKSLATQNSNHNTAAWTLRRFKLCLPTHCLQPS